MRQRGDCDAVLELRLGVTDRWQGQDGKALCITHWVDTVLWRELASQFDQLPKGAPVLIEGRLYNDSWLDKDQQRRTMAKVEARQVTLLARRATSEAAG